MRISQGVLSAGVLSALSACASPAVRCNGHLQAINRPVAGALPGTPRPAAATTATTATSSAAAATGSTKSVTSRGTP